MSTVTFCCDCCCLHQDLQRSSSKKDDQGATEKISLEDLSSMPLILQYPVPYTHDIPTPLLVSQSPSKLHFGNPYSISDSKGKTFQEVLYIFHKLLRLIIFFFIYSSYIYELLYVPADEREEEEFLDDQPLKLPPVGPPSWDSNVVCIQPTRNHSRPEDHEESEENNNVMLPPCSLIFTNRQSFFSCTAWLWNFDSLCNIKSE